MRIIVRFKSGFELPITCDDFSITTHVMTGEITDYDIKGIKDNKPIFFRSEDVECIFRDITAERSDDADPDRVSPGNIVINEQGRLKYCPLCGSRMRGEDYETD
jgi:NADH pyrophosphatase NudC (nudix superfamily)